MRSSRRPRWPGWLPNRRAPSAGAIEAIYLAAKQQGKAAQAQNPGQFEQECAGLRKMADPAEVAKLEAAAKEMEAWADKLEADAKARGK